MGDFFSKLLREKISSILILIGILLIVVSIILFLWADLELSLDQRIDAEKFGQLGDFIGGLIGSLWALAGIILYYVALKEQRNELKISREALSMQIKAFEEGQKDSKKQIEEMQSTRRIYEQQSKTSKTQQFNSIFSTTLGIYSTLKNGLCKQGEDYFHSIYSEISFTGSFKIEEIHKENLKNFNDLYVKESGKISNYFRLVYRILKIIDSSELLDEQQRRFYSKIFRAQFSDYEQLILFYNSYTKYGEKNKELFLKYQIFKNLPLYIEPGYSYFIGQDSSLTLFIDQFSSFLLDKKVMASDYNYDGSYQSEDMEDFNCQFGFKSEDPGFLFFEVIFVESEIQIDDDKLLSLLENIIRIVFGLYQYKTITITSETSKNDREKRFTLEIP